MLSLNFANPENLATIDTPHRLFGRYNLRTTETPKVVLDNYAPCRCRCHWAGSPHSFSDSRAALQFRTLSSSSRRVHKAMIMAKPSKAKGYGRRYQRRSKGHPPRRRSTQGATLGRAPGGVWGEAPKVCPFSIPQVHLLFDEESLASESE